MVECLIVIWETLFCVLAPLLGLGAIAAVGFGLCH